MAEQTEKLKFCGDGGGGRRWRASDVGAIYELVDVMDIDRKNVRKSVRNENKFRIRLFLLNSKFTANIIEF